MDRKAVVAALLPALFLYACERASDISEPGEPVPAATGQASKAPPSPSTRPEGAAPPGYTDGSGINEGYPDLSPPPLTPEAERGVKGATNVLISFARAIELKEFDQAWAMLSEPDRKRWSKSEFTRMFADLGRITVGFEPGAIEGAAGSSFYTAPIYLTSSDKEGRPVRYDGEARLRRVNDVEGASPAQLRWHFDKLTLDWTH